MTSEEIYKNLKNFKVGIAGCGGLGSNCAVALARVNIGCLVIADFDIVDVPNLNRQYYFLDQVGEKKVNALRNNLIRIDPNINVETHDTNLSEKNIHEIFHDCDIVVEALDKKEMKQMLIETMRFSMPEIPVIVGNGIAGYGKSNSIEVARFGNIFVCGDNLSEISIDSPPLAPRVGIVANMQANTVMEILLDKIN